MAACGRSHARNQTHKGSVSSRSDQHCQVTARTCLARKFEQFIKNLVLPYECDVCQWPQLSIALPRAFLRSAAM
eukprot:4214915-Amphidinium_carterae.1